MEENLKQLLLKDLCARLPYDTKAAHKTNSNVYGLISDADRYGNLYLQHYGTLKIDEIKPYLRTMSSMTEEERDELSHYDNAVQRTDFFYSHHIDCRYMIEKGLALEAPEGMYK